MKRWALFCGAMLIFAGIAAAQGTPKAEVFGGYSYLRVSDQGVSANLNGGSGSLSYNVGSALGIVADFGVYHFSQSGGSANVTSYLFGPKYAVRSGKITPFVQGLFGGAHASAGLTGSCSTARVRPEASACTTGASANAFAFALGGGLDVNATPHIGVRLVQAEYLMSKFKDSANNRQNNARVSAGVVFRW
ncbi:MAG TPA: outer membrane beta-barrel protein [Candidatus Acidoferrales bacterium]|nr:outer membrane beta-barrel protein [Candidatus Acidoferrales bacterium]